MFTPSYYAYVKKKGGGGGGGGVIKHTTLFATYNEACLGYMGILDICVNNQSRGYGVFKLNFRDILNYFMLLITGIFVSKLQGIRDICTSSK